VVLKGRKGSPGYIAPEIWESEAYSGYIADTFSAVVVFYIMVTGKPPFANTKKDNPHYFPRRQNKYDLFWQYQRNVDLSHALKDLFWVSFSKLPGERYTIKDLRMHPAIAG
jgi:serine/threonine protein kinase